MTHKIDLSKPIRSLVIDDIKGIDDRKLIKIDGVEYTVSHESAAKIQEFSVTANHLDDVLNALKLQIERLT